MDYIDLYKHTQLNRVVSQDLNTNMLSHCYLVVSSDNVFLHEIAKLFVKQILCLSASDKPCEKCNNCLKVNHNNMVDVIYYPKEDKTIVVEDVVEIVSDCYITPIENEYKIYVLENFDECTIQAQNKLLKTLEEPPRNVIFILTARSSLQILPTILSRSKVVTESPISTELLKEFLDSKKIQNSDTISQMSNGSIEFAIKLSESKDANKIVDLVFDVLTNLKTSKELLRFSSKILELKKEIPFFVETLISALRDISVFNKGVELVFKNKLPEYKILIQMYTPSVCFHILPKICEIYDKFEFNCNPAGVVDKLLLDILEGRFLWQK